MAISLNKIVKPEEIATLGPLVKEIWEETFTPIIGKEQVDYMLSVYQSKAEIQRQIQEEEAEYFTVYFDEDAVGYVAYRKESQRLFISKIYLLKHYQGQGIASILFVWLEEIAELSQLKSLYLHVNQNNEQAIEIYQHKGFVNQGEIVTDIAGGFLMEDYIFEKILS